MKQPRVIAIFCKRNDEKLLDHITEVALFLRRAISASIEILIEPSLSKQLSGFSTWHDDDLPTLHHTIDLVIALGGDGLLLYISSLFQTYVPPLAAFNFGSMGFLTPFNYADHEAILREIFVRTFVTLRYRLECVVVFSDASKQPKTFQVLNEVVVDRGNSPFLSNIDCFCDDEFVTNIQADGLIVSTATGSTAYNLSAGGSMCFPTLNTMTLTAISPHVLSFRPVIFPAHVQIRLQLPLNSRSAGARINFDGRPGPDLRAKDFVIIRVSRYPVPTLTRTGSAAEWLGSLAKCLRWNERVRQGAAGKKKKPSVPKLFATPPHAFEYVNEKEEAHKAIKEE